MVDQLELQAKVVFSGDITPLTRNLTSMASMIDKTIAGVNIRGGAGMIPAGPGAMGGAGPPMPRGAMVGGDWFQNMIGGLSASMQPMQQIAAAMELIFTKTKEAGTGFEEATKKKHKLDTNLKKTTDTAKGFIGKIVEMGGKLRSISRLFFYASLDMMQFANAILGPIMGGLRIWYEYERALARVYVNVESMGEDGAAAMEQLGDAIGAMSKEWEFSQLQMAKAAAALGAARIPVDDIVESLGDLAGIARVNFIEMDTAAQLTLRIMRQFRISLEDATAEMWRMSGIAQHTGETIYSIVNKMGYATEMGQILGFTFSEIAASMTLLTEKYGTASIAGRRLATVYSRLLEVGEEYGIQLRSLDGDMLSQREQIASLADYLDLIGDPIEQNQYLLALFGRTGADAARTLIDAFKEGRLDKVMEDTGDATIEAMKRVADSMDDLTYIGVADLQSSVQDLQKTIAQELAPVLDKLVTDLVPLITKTAEWVSENKDAIIAVASLGVALAGLASIIRIMGFLIEIVVAVATIIAGLGAVLNILGWVLAYVGVEILGLAGGPIAVMATTLAVIVALIILIIGIIAGFVIEIQKLGKHVNKAGKEVSFLGAIFKALGGILKVIIGIGKILLGIILAIGLGIFAIGYFIGAIIPHFLDWLGVLEPIIGFLDWLAGLIDAIGTALDDFADSLLGALAALLPHSPTMADRFLELGDSIDYALGPMQEATMWSRRLRHSMGAMNVNANIGFGAAVEQGVAAGMGGAGGGAAIVNIDGVLIHDPEELAEIVSQRLISESRRSYRSGPY